MSRTVIPLVGLAFAVCCLQAGCSNKDRWQRARPAVVKVKGLVTHDSQPLAGAIVSLLPIAGNHTAFGRTDGDGSFVLTTFDDGDGAVPGEYKVSVTQIVVEHEPNPKDPEHLPPLHHAEYSLIPETYGDAEKSGLSVTIPEGGTEDIVLHLTGEPQKKYAGRKK